MPEENLEDPTLSAVVTILPSADRTTVAPVGGIDLGEDLRAVGLAKQRFTTSGFEVHAPMGSSFSIGGRLSLFESFFAVKVVVDDSQLMRRVTIDGGGDLELPLAALTEELQGLVRSVQFAAPPDFLAPRPPR